MHILIFTKFKFIGVLFRQYANDTSRCMSYITRYMYCTNYVFTLDISLENRVFSNHIGKTRAR